MNRIKNRLVSREQLISLDITNLREKRSMYITWLRVERVVSRSSRSKIRRDIRLNRANIRASLSFLEMNNLSLSRADLAGTRVSDICRSRSRDYDR